MGSLFVLIHYLIGVILFLLHGFGLVILLVLLILLSGLIQNLLGFLFYVIDFLKTAIVVLFLTLIILALLFYCLILGEDVLWGFLDGIRPDQNLLLIQCFKNYPAEGERFDDSTELGQVEFPVSDGEALGGEIDEYFADAYVAVLFELGDVDEVGPGEVVLIDDDELAADFVACGGEVAELVIIYAHLTINIIYIYWSWELQKRWDGPPEVQL